MPKVKKSEQSIRSTVFHVVRESDVPLSVKDVAGILSSTDFVGIAASLNDLSVRERIVRRVDGNTQMYSFPDKDDSVFTPQITEVTPMPEPSVESNNTERDDLRAAIKSLESRLSKQVPVIRRLGLKIDVIHDLSEVKAFDQRLLDFLKELEADLVALRNSQA